jgi:hypothetical protein
MSDRRISATKVWLITGSTRGLGDTWLVSHADCIDRTLPKAGIQM